MQKWEYLTLATVYNEEHKRYTTISTWERGQSKGETVPNSEHFIATINRLGEAGWEMIAASSTDYIFKRPK